MPPYDKTMQHNPVTTEYQCPGLIINNTPNNITYLDTHSDTLIIYVYIHKIIYAI